MLVKRAIAILSLVLFCGLLSACNTTRGVGQDIEAGGEAIQRSTY
ncbi:entericidin A/B family lipoprotein [Budviciaceae bacterium BWR-B9]|uniref:Entericidin A/B family lipoprotein n=3 Tax=Limnobaculum TaxID=2172100 RepID=A0A9D7AHH8_9GAMM|nr:MULTISPECIES: entericidin A/B family lipoprotein [Limnobaculum]MBK5072713.1 entericidin A/B family lipoprotein [Limnobaculum xujianqingii]MBK5142599.1 entericidin A/B family lipoprotein [Limnobaculum allomyrinae]MBK5176022.1 entericidin A/B family lipoprotein [Limnobaculum xujianqingii]MBV7690516.1 entericidin A/B family lipoprotein [Limnobaculum sp. M2-1]QBH96606.1 entericidin A/B family lipoprotein [Limnobaculum zhutongyuii]